MNNASEPTFDNFVQFRFREKTAFELFLLCESAAGVVTFLASASAYLDIFRRMRNASEVLHALQPARSKRHAPKYLLFSLG